MALRKIASVGHPILRQRARAVEPSDLATPRIQTLIDDLIDTMRDANGAGLAATQIYEVLRICVIEVGNNPRYPYKPKIPLTILINPVITSRSSETFLNFEGCLSVPNLRGRVERFAQIHVDALSRDGEALSFDANGISAGTFQHECDHLDGKVFLDRVTDPASLTTWENFERHHQAEFTTYVQQIVARYGS